MNRPGDEFLAAKGDLTIEVFKEMSLRVRFEGYLEQFGGRCEKVVVEFHNLIHCQLVAHAGVLLLAMGGCVAVVNGESTAAECTTVDLGSGS